MLASLLPGLREVRAPLAAGYAWLLAGWLALEDLLPEKDQATGVYAALIDLHDTVTAVGIAAVLSAAAYLLGAISEGIFGGLWRGQLGIGGIFYTAPFSDRGERALTELARRRADAAADQLRQHGTELTSLQTASDQSAAYVELSVLMAEARKSRGNAVEPPSENPDADARAELASALARRVTDELDLLRTRLLGVETDLFGAVDRMRAEAELRFALAPPLIALIGVFAVRDSIIWLAGLLGVFVLIRQGRTRLQESGDMLIDALRVGRVDAPTLERVYGELEKLSVAS